MSSRVLLDGLTSTTIDTSNPSPAESAPKPTYVYDLENFSVVHLGRYVTIYRGADQLALKEFRAISGSAQAESLISMVQALHQQESQIDLLQNNSISPIRVANARIVGKVVPAIAVPWYKNGNILAYLSRNPNVNKLDLIIDTACALEGLHSINIIHGNLHPGNVVIMDNGRACITDVGVYISVIQALQGNDLPVPPQWPFKSPEELIGDIHTFHTDVYSFACTVYSIYTGHNPIKCTPRSQSSFPGILNIIEGTHAGLLGRSQPRGLNDQVWSILMRCWAINPAARPTMKTVESELRALKRQLTL